MRIVVIGGMGRIGARMVDRLRRQRHAVPAATPVPRAVPPTQPLAGGASSMLRGSLAAFAFTLASVAAAAAEGLPPGEARVTPLYAQALPNLPGKSLKGVLVEYGPGAGSPPHHHAASALIVATVLEGAIRSQVNDGPARVYQAGESFTEMPGDHHRVSENASATAPARLLAVFVVDAAEVELTIPDRR